MSICNVYTGATHAQSNEASDNVTVRLVDINVKTIKVDQVEVLIDCIKGLGQLDSTGLSAYSTEK